MSWRPVNPSHAIERVRFVVKFRENVPSKLSRQMGDRIAAIRHETRLDGPSPVTAISFGVQIIDGQQLVAPQQSTVQGWQYVRKATNGQSLESVSLQGDQIIYETAEYRRWKTFKQRFEKIVAGLVEVASATLDVENVSLEYVDRFIFDGAPENASPAALLVGIDKYIHPDAASGRTLWHLHHGWFENHGDGDVLINQNFDAQDTVVEERKKSARSILILTRAELRSVNYPAVNEGPLPVHLDLLHDLTKSYFKNSVRADLHSSVGIH